MFQTGKEDESLVDVTYEVVNRYNSKRMVISLEMLFPHCVIDSLWQVSSKNAFKVYVVNPLYKTHKMALYYLLHGAQNCKASCEALLLLV